MAIKSIMFRPDMVRALLAGRKCQTRRPLKPQCYTIGTRLWVREKHMHIANIYTAGRVLEHVRYESDGATLTHEWVGDDKHPPTRDWWNTGRAPWTSARYMPRRYARLWLIVLGVRQEQVQDISEADAVAEGMVATPVATPREVFAELWDDIYDNRPGYRWDDNPWVWVYEFEVERCSGKSTTD